MKKIALITGGSSGLGFAFAEILGKENYKILIVARTKEKIEKAILKLKENQIEAEGFVCDVSDLSQLQNMSETIKSLYSTLDFLILNAGVVTPQLLNEYTDPLEIKKDIDIDLMGYIYSTFYFSPLLKSGSKILMISSGFGLVGSAGYSIYCAAKAGIVNFAESIRRELLHKNIRVYVACPGDMDTPQFEYEISHQADWMKQSSPRKVMSVSKAAGKILKQCKGKYHFLILTGSDVKLLNIVSKILPRKWRDWLVDRMLPVPK
ncbi:MAG: short-chain dehydrogenase [Bacteroidetes bacterium]|nr:short-chain dehydrogenase [Bacteroidota bacterium]